MLESREAHYLVIGLVLLDLALVLAELVLSSFFPSPDLAPHMGEGELCAAAATLVTPTPPLHCPPHAVHGVDEALGHTSIGLLAVFASELVAKLMVFGLHYFTHSRQAVGVSFRVCQGGGRTARLCHRSPPQPLPSPPTHPPSLRPTPCVRVCT